MRELAGTVVYMSQEMQLITNEYYENNAEKLRMLVIKKLRKFGGIDGGDYQDFFSVANETFVDVIKKYDSKRGNFKSFLSKCLDNAIKEEMTKRNARKRNCDIVTEEGERIKMTVSLDALIKDADVTIGQTLMSPANIEEEITKDILSEEMTQYLDGLSKKQRKILDLKTKGFGRSEIIKKMSLFEWEYDWEIKEITSLEKTLSLKRDLKRKNKIISNNKNDKLSEEEKTMSGSNNENVEKKMRSRTLTVNQVLDDIESGYILLNYPLQRQMAQWTRGMESDLIVTAILGFGIPEILIANQIINGLEYNWLIDGLQRCSVFMEYKNDKFKIKKNTDRSIVKYQKYIKDEKGEFVLDILGKPKTECLEFDVAGKKYSELPKEIQKKIDKHPIQICEYLNCDDDDIEYHIRCRNASRPMKPAQKGITFLGQRCGAIIKKYAQNATFFKNNVGVGYGPSDFRNGNIERTICESLMTINFPEKWSKSFESISIHLRENLTDSKLNYFSSLVERLEAVVDLETMPMFNTKNSPVLFAAFDKFLTMNIPDYKFNEFLKQLKYEMEDKVVNGTSWAELATKASKDKKIILEKINLLEKLMVEYFNLKIPQKIEDFDIPENVKKYVEEFGEIETIQNLGIEDQNRKERLALRTLAATCGEKNLADEKIQVLTKEVKDEVLENAILCTMDLDLWAKETDEKSPIFREENIPYLVRCTQYVYEENMDEKLAIKWFKNYVQQFDMKEYRKIDNDEALNSLRMLFELKQKSA